MDYSQNQVPRTEPCAFWQRWNSLQIPTVYPTVVPGVQTNMQHDATSSGGGYGKYKRGLAATNHVAWACVFDLAQFYEQVHRSAWLMARVLRRSV